MFEEQSGKFEVVSTRLHEDSIAPGLPVASQVEPRPTPTTPGISMKLSNEVFT